MDLHAPLSFIGISFFNLDYSDSSGLKLVKFIFRLLEKAYFGREGKACDGFFSLLISGHDTPTL